MRQQRVRRYRLNTRALTILGVGLALAIIAGAGWAIFGGNSARAALLAQAKAQLDLKPPRYDVALGYLNEYLAVEPEDVEALDEKARVLADTAQNGDHLIEAIKVAEQAVRLEPDTPRAQALRLRLLTLYLRMARYVSLDALRLQTAEKVGRELIDKGDTSAESRRLLGQVLEARALTGDKAALTEAVRFYEAALKVDPTDVGGAELLAAILQDPLRLNRPAEARAVIDRLLAACTAAEKRAAAG